MPSSRWPGGNGVGRDEFLAPESVAGGGDGDAFLHGVEVGFLFEFLLKLLTACFEEFDIRFAVGFHFLPYDEMVVVDFLLVTLFEFGFLFGGHAVGIVHVSRRHGSFVLLVF